MTRKYANPLMLKTPKVAKQNTQQHFHARKSLLPTCADSTLSFSIAHAFRCSPLVTNESSCLSDVTSSCTLYICLLDIRAISSRTLFCLLTYSLQTQRQEKRRKCVQNNTDIKDATLHSYSFDTKQMKGVKSTRTLWTLTVVSPLKIDH